MNSTLLDASDITQEMRIIREKPLDLGLCGHFISAYLHLCNDIRGTADGDPEEP